MPQNVSPVPVPEHAFHAARPCLPSPLSPSCPSRPSSKVLSARARRVSGGGEVTCLSRQVAGRWSSWEGQARPGMGHGGGGVGENNTALIGEACRFRSPIPLLLSGAMLFPSFEKMKHHHHQHQTMPTHAHHLFLPRVLQVAGRGEGRPAWPCLQVGRWGEEKEACLCL